MRGAAWVFVRSGSTWTQQGPKLVGTGVRPRRLRRRAGQRGAVGGWEHGADRRAVRQRHMGAVWVFTRSGVDLDPAGTEAGRRRLPSSSGRASRCRRMGTRRWSAPRARRLGGGGVGVHPLGIDLVRRVRSFGDRRGGGAAMQGWGVALSGDGNTALIGGPDDGASPNANDGWARRGCSPARGRRGRRTGSKLVGGGTVGNAFQGSSVALSGDGSTALVGGRMDNGNTGAAWVFVPGQPPTITSFSPASGITGSQVTITRHESERCERVRFGSLEASFTVGVGHARSGRRCRMGRWRGRFRSRLRGDGDELWGASRRRCRSRASRLAAGRRGRSSTSRGSGSRRPRPVKFNGTAATSVSYVRLGRGEGDGAGGRDERAGHADEHQRAGGDGPGAREFTVPPAIDSFSPTSGITGSQVTIAGSGLSGATHVRFGSLAARSRWCRTRDQGDGAGRGGGGEGVGDDAGGDGDER